MSRTLLSFGLSLALAFFSIACSQDSGGPIGPEGLVLAAPPDACTPWPDCKDGDGSGDPEPEYQVDIAGDVAGSGQTSTETSGVVARGYTLDLTLLQAAVDQGGTCFADGSYTGNFVAGQADDGSIGTGFFFFATTSTGASVKYNFRMSGTLAPGDVWPPTSASGPADVTLTSWSVQHDSGGSKKTACSGAGELAATMIVTVVE